MKYLYYTHRNDVAKLSYGTAGQLRSACIHADIKKLYVVDLPRVSGRDNNIRELISVIKDLKNGFVLSSYYGQSKDLLMNPPFVFIFTNRPIPENTLSADRWVSIQVTEDYKVADFTKNDFRKYIADMKEEKRKEKEAMKKFLSKGESNSENLKKPTKKVNGAL